ncbi:MAG: endonuclease/exonuclease/phosphatase family protein [Betaproteobacteria bacterium]
MKLITWNIQWARGIDGAVDTARIARTANKLADFDVLCLQEVAVNFPGLPGGHIGDQVIELSKSLPGYSAHYGAALDVDDGHGGRSLFGNLILSRLPVMQVYRHLLPRPLDPAVKSMQRIAVEAIIEAPWGPLRLITTHLEYYSASQRMAQAGALRVLHAEACAQAASVRPAEKADGPFRARPRPASAILAGDFNCQSVDPEYLRIMEGFDAEGTPAFLDAWTIAHPHEPYPPSAGIYERSWAKTPLCCDFVFVTADIAPRVRSVAIDGHTQASDHQPVVVDFGGHPASA